MRIVSVGEILWDVIGKNEYLGGAPLELRCPRPEARATKYIPLSAVGADARGRKALDLLKARGMSTEFVQVLERQAHRHSRSRTRHGRQAHVSHRATRGLRLRRSLPTKNSSASPNSSPTGSTSARSTTCRGQALASTKKLLKAVPNARRFYDVNLREGHWSLATIEQLSSLATVTKLSDSEAESLDASVDASEGPGHSIENFCRRWSDRFGCKTMCVTFGERGCAILKDGKYSQAPGYHVTVADTVGAGDAFSAAFVHGLSQGWDSNRIALCANAVGALVASRSGAIPNGASPKRTPS